MKKILLVGSGNVATHLAKNLDRKKYIVNQIFSRNEKKAKNLKNILNCKWTNDPKQIISADLTIIAINDDNIKKVLSDLPKNPTVHTSGNTNISVLKNHFSDFGVLYPLQTFKKDIEMKINNVPFLIEANNKIFENKLFDLASSFSNKVEKVNSTERKKIHLAAVIACNFSNHMLVLAKNIMKNSNLEFSLLLPLIKKTFSQINDNPIKLQTGPASRKDMKVINEHLELIKDKNINFLYELISKSIIDSNEKNS